ncbi:MAG: hypothetical protein AMXMBFR58_35830 [Phycisphaerae bacterium]|nr:hypothetical protein [Phycisphaerales bacterium]
MNTRTFLFAFVLLAAPCAGQILPARDRTGSTAPPPTTAVAREGCVTTECHPGVKSKAFVHGPVRVNGCDGCHLLDNAEKHLFKPAAPRGEMCALCHDPQTPDSPVLHDPYAQGDCLSCHDPHGSSAPQMLRGERYADACASCHQDVTGAHDQVHGPASAGACGACHQPHAAKYPRLLIAQGRDLCLKCHLRTAMEIQDKPLVHDPVNGDCGICHAPHATDHPAILISDPVKLCTDCHQHIASTVTTASTQHAAVTTQRACLNCHEAHASTHAALLKQESKQLCFECHDKPIKLDDGTTIANMKKLIEGKPSLHGAITQRGCVECHEIHGGGHRKLLTNEYPSDLYYPFNENAYALCFSCHDRQMVLLSRTSTATGFRNGDTNLHYVHVNRDKKGRSCALCHDAHAASRDNHIRDEVPYGKKGWKLPIKFTSIENGGSCAAGCHAAFEYNRVTPVAYPEHKPGVWNGEEFVPGVWANPPDGEKSTPPANPGK